LPFFLTHPPPPEIHTLSLHDALPICDGGVHSHISHLYGLIAAANEFGLKKTFVHAFTDGRDVDPKSGANFISDLQNHLINTPTKLATVTGRYYAMDRDKRWERVKLAYDAIVNSIGEKSTNVVATIENNYANDITDEFIKPIIAVDENYNPVASVKEGDVIIFFNFRTD